MKEDPTTEEPGGKYNPARMRMRVTDRNVLKLIRMWLKAPIIEEDEDGNEHGSRPEKGTPQGGVISPLLANLYLHWFDVRFHEPGGPADVANAKLVRYADDFLVMARYQGKGLKKRVRELIEDWLELTLNREKTEVVNLKKGNRLDFLGYSFRYDRDKYGRSHRYLNMFPSKKAQKKERARVKEMTGKKWSLLPLPELIDKLNRHLRGWANYFNKGYHSEAFGNINHHVKERLGRFLRRSSQRPYQPPEGVTLYRHLDDLGLIKV